MWQKASALESVVQKLQKELGRPAEEDEVAGKIGVTMVELFNIINETKSMPIRSLENLGITKESGAQQSLLGCLAERVMRFRKHSPASMSLKKIL